MTNKPANVCCPKFDPKTWDEKSVKWDKQMFITDSMTTFLHIPLFPPIGKIIGKLWKQAEDAKASPELKDWLLLANDPTPFRCDYYMMTTKKVDGAKNTTLSGNFMTKVFDGPYSAVPKWLKEMNEYLKSKGKTAKDFYFYYTTCPKCAKKYGHNYVVLFAQI